MLYEQVDETGVPSVRLSAASEENQSYKFPLAGQSNAVASLKLIKFTLDTEVRAASLEIVWKHYKLLLKTVIIHYFYNGPGFKKHI